MYSTKKINDTTRGGRENLLPEKKKKGLFQTVEYTLRGLLRYTLLQKKIIGDNLSSNVL